MIEHETDIGQLQGLGQCGNFGCAVGSHQTSPNPGTLVVRESVEVTMTFCFKQQLESIFTK